MLKKELLSAKRILRSKKIDKQTNLATKNVSAKNIWQQKIIVSKHNLSAKIFGSKKSVEANK